MRGFSATKRSLCHTGAPQHLLDEAGSCTIVPCPTFMHAAARVARLWPCTGVVVLTTISRRVALTREALRARQCSASLTFGGFVSAFSSLSIPKGCKRVATCEPALRGRNPWKASPETCSSKLDRAPLSLARCSCTLLPVWHACGLAQAWLCLPQSHAAWH
jgi:hypothetical protein